MENLNNLGIFGVNAEDIKEILLERPLNDNGKEVENLYVKYNDGHVVVIPRGEMTQNEFFKKVNHWMVKDLGLKVEDRGNKWNALINNEANKAKFNEFSVENVMDEELDLNNSDEVTAENIIVYDNADAKKYKMQRNAVAGALIGLGLLGLGGYTLSKNLNNKKAAEPVIETTAEVNDDFSTVSEDIEKVAVKSFAGYYANDLKDVNDFEGVLAKYDVNKSAQLNRSNTILNTAKDFNRKVTLLDGTVVNGGLTVEQLGAIEIYSNIDKYNDIDLIKRAGLMDFNTISDDFEQGTKVVAAMFADKEVSGESLANLFEDEKAKEFYLKLDGLRLQVLNATDVTEKNKAVKEINDLFANTLDRASDNYVDYSEHPGMAFAVSAEVIALDSYNNVALNKTLVQDLIIIGKDGETQKSKLDSICAKANVKLDSAVELVNSMKLFIDTVDYNEIALENLDATSREAIAKFASVEYENMSEAEKVDVRSVLSTNKGLAAFVVNHGFNQEKLNSLMNASLAKEDKLVTVEEQELILQNAVKVINQAILDGSKARFKDEKTRKIAQQLQKPGDTYKEETKSVTYTGDAANKLEVTHPDETEKAKEEENKKKGLDDASTPEKKEEVQKKIDKEVEETTKVGQNYVNQVVAYYQAHGDVAGIPAELQAAYNDLGQALFDQAKSTGIARYQRDHNPEFEGGKTTINPEYSDIEVTEVTPSEATTVKSETKIETNEIVNPVKPVVPEKQPEVKEDTKTQSTVDVKTEVKVTPEVKEETKTQTKTETKVEEEKTTTTTTTETKSETSSNTNGGDIVINPEWADYEITDISTDPEITSMSSEADIDAYIESLSNAASEVEESSFTLK